MRLYRIDEHDLEGTVRDPLARQKDERGDLRLTGQTHDGRPILVIVAGDDPNLVTTAFLRS